MVYHIYTSVTLVHVPVAVLIREDSTVESLQLEHLGTLRCEGVECRMKLMGCATMRKRKKFTFIFAYNMHVSQVM